MHNLTVYAGATKEPQACNRRLQAIASLAWLKAEPQGTSMNSSSNIIPIRNASTRHEEHRQPLEFGPGARIAIMVASSIATWGLVAAFAALVGRTVAAV
jgi:hypothetical protein